MNSIPPTYPCCGSITGRHQSTCSLFTPTGKHRLSELQRGILRAAVENDVDGASVRGRGEDAAAQALAKRGLVTLRREYGAWSRHSAYATLEGKRAAELLGRYR